MFQDSDSQLGLRLHGCYLVLLEPIPSSRLKHNLSRQEVVALLF